MLTLEAAGCWGAWQPGGRSCCWVWWILPGCSGTIFPDGSRVNSPWEGWEGCFIILEALFVQRWKCRGWKGERSRWWTRLSSLSSVGTCGLSCCSSSYVTSWGNQQRAHRETCRSWLAPCRISWREEGVGQRGPSWNQLLCLSSYRCWETSECMYSAVHELLFSHTFLLFGYVDLNETITDIKVPTFILKDVIMFNYV